MMRGARAVNDWGDDYRRVLGRPWTGVALLALAASVCLAQAESRPATSPAQVESLAVAHLRDVPGVKAGMSSDELIDLSLEAAQAYRWQDAEKILTEVIRQEPRNIRAYIVAAQVFEIHASAVGADAADPDAAAKKNTLIDQAVKTYVEYAARLAMEANDYQTAEQVYKTVLQYERHRYNPQVLLGMARIQAARNSVQAIDRYKTYINPRLCPQGAKDAQAHLELGRIYLDRGFINQAVSTLEKARNLDPENAEILLALARAYLATPFRAKAVTVAAEAVGKAPANPAYRDVYAQIILSQIDVPQGGGGLSAEARERFAEARRQSEEAVRLARAEVQAAPGDARVLRVLETCYLTQRRILDIASQMSGAGARSVVELARCRDELAAVQHTLALHKVLDDLQRAPEAARSDPVYLETLADLQARVYRLQDAAETCRQLQKLDPANASAKRILEWVGKAASGQTGGPTTAPTGPGPGA